MKCPNIKKTAEMNKAYFVSGYGRQRRCWLSTGSSVCLQPGNGNRFDLKVLTKVMKQKIIPRSGAMVDAKPSRG
jgi:hypothetical protein